MAEVTLETLRARVREAADMNSSSFVTDEDTSLDAFINSEASALYDLILDRSRDFFTTTEALDIVSGTSAYALPEDFYRLRGVSLTVNSEVHGLRPMSAREIGIWGKAPTSDFTGELQYAPALTPLAAATDVLDLPQGWHDYVVVGAAIWCVGKEERDVDFLRNQKNETWGRIASALDERSGPPGRMVDVRKLKRTGLPRYRIVGENLVLGWPGVGP